MDSQDVSLFRLSLEGKLGPILEPFEYVVSSTASDSPAKIFALTSNGRILTIDESFRVTGVAKLPPQKKPSSSSRIVYDAVAGMLLVHFNSTLHFIVLSDDKPDAEVLYSKRDVAIFDVSQHGCHMYYPDFDFVCVSSKNQVSRIILSIDQECRETVMWKWRADSQVSAISFEGTGLCLTTQTGCNVYSFDESNSDPMILAFPIDRSALPLVPAPPTICYVNEGVFVVGGCMPDIALFVDGSGSAARPPLVWSSENPIEMVKTQNSLIVIGEKKIIVFDDSPSGRMRQELPLPSPPCATACLSDSLVVVTRLGDADFFILRQISWAEKTHQLLLKGEIESAVYVASNNQIRSEEDTIAYQQAHMQLGFVQLFSGKKEKEDEGIELLLRAQVTPLEVQLRFKAVFDLVESPEEKFSDIVLLEKLVSRAIDEDWANDQSEDWATLLIIARIRLCEIPVDLLEILECDQKYDRAAIMEYCEKRKLPNCLLILHSLSDPISSAISMEWLDTSLLPLIDRQLLVKLLERLPMGQTELVSKWADFILEEDESREDFIQFVKTRSNSIDSKFVMNLFRGRDDELEVILYNFKCDNGKNEPSMKMRLVELATARLASDQISASESEGLRDKVVDVLLDGSNEEMMKLLIGDHVKVERAVAEHRDHPEGAIHAVMEHVESAGALHAIQKIIHRFSTSHSSLSSHFLLQLKRKCESDPSAATSLRLPEVMKTVLEASPSHISANSIDFIPDNSRLDTFAPLLFRQMQSINDRSVSNRIGRALAERIAGSLESPASQNSFRINESSRCGVCSNRFDNLSTIHFLPSGKVVHPSCQPYINLCPVTNQVFRG